MIMSKRNSFVFALALIVPAIDVLFCHSAVLGILTTVFGVVACVVMVAKRRFDISVLCAFCVGLTIAVEVLLAWSLNQRIVDTAFAMRREVLEWRDSHGGAFPEVANEQFQHRECFGYAIRYAYGRHSAVKPYLVLDVFNFQRRGLDIESGQLAAPSPST